MNDLIAKYGYVLFIRPCKWAEEHLDPNSDIGQITLLLWENKVDEALQLLSTKEGDPYRYIEGLIYSSLKNDEVVAFAKYQLCSPDYLPAINNISRNYYYGLGVPEDRVKAREMNEVFEHKEYGAGILNLGVFKFHALVEEHTGEHYGTDKIPIRVFEDPRFLQILEYFDKAISLGIFEASVQKVNILLTKYKSEACATGKCPSYRLLKKLKDSLSMAIQNNNQNALKLVPMLDDICLLADRERIDELIRLCSDGVFASIDKANNRLTLKFTKFSEILAQEFKDILERNKSFADLFVKLASVELTKLGMPCDSNTCTGIEIIHHNE